MAIINETTNNNTLNDTGTGDIISDSGNNNIDNLEGRLQRDYVTGSNETVNVSGLLNSVNFRGGTPGSTDLLNLIGSATAAMITSTGTDQSALDLTLSQSGTSTVSLLDSQSDTLTIKSGFNNVVVGSGNDTFVINGGSNSVTEGNGADSTSISGGSNSVTLGNGVNEVTLSGGTTNLNARASAEGTTIYDNGGINTITGNANEAVVFNGSRLSYLVQIVSGTAGSATANYEITDLSHPGVRTYLSGNENLYWGGTTAAGPYQGESLATAITDSHTTFSGDIGDKSVTDVAVTYSLAGAEQFAPNPMVSGQITVSDAINPTEAQMVAGAYSGTYGALTLAANGAYQYVLNDQNTAVKALLTGQYLTDTITVHSADGTALNILITVNGTNDPAEIFLANGDHDSAVLSQPNYVWGLLPNLTPGWIAQSTPSTSAHITVFDPDLNQSAFQAETNVAGAYGTFSIDASGNWSYTENVTSSAVMSIPNGTTVTDSFQVLSLDGSASHTISINVTGIQQPIQSSFVPVQSSFVPAAANLDIAQHAAGTPIVVGELTAVSPNYTPQASDFQLSDANFQIVADPLHPGQFLVETNATFDFINDPNLQILAPGVLQEDFSVSSTVPGSNAVNVALAVNPEAFFTHSNGTEAIDASNMAIDSNSPDPLVAQALGYYDQSSLYNTLDSNNIITLNESFYGYAGTDNPLAQDLQLGSGEDTVNFDAGTNTVIAGSNNDTYNLNDSGNTIDINDTSSGTIQTAVDTAGGNAFNIMTAASAVLSGMDLELTNTGSAADDLNLSGTMTGNTIHVTDSANADNLTFIAATASGDTITMGTGGSQVMVEANSSLSSESLYLSGGANTLEVDSSSVFTGNYVELQSPAPAPASLSVTFDAASSDGGSNQFLMQGQSAESLTLTNASYDFVYMDNAAAASATLNNSANNYIETDGSGVDTVNLNGSTSDQIYSFGYPSQVVLNLSGVVSGLSAGLSQDASGDNVNYIAATASGDTLLLGSGDNTVSVENSSTLNLETMNFSDGSNNLNVDSSSTMAGATINLGSNNGNSSLTVDFAALSSDGGSNTFSLNGSQDESLSLINASNDQVSILDGGNDSISMSNTSGDSITVLGSGSETMTFDNSSGDSVLSLASEIVCIGTISDMNCITCHCSTEV